MVTMVLFGYRKLSKDQADLGEFGPKGLRIVKDPNCTAVIRQMGARVQAGESYAQISDWLNDSDIAPGSYVRSRKWTGKLVREFLMSELLHGERVFRKTLYSTEFRTGRKRRSQNLPDQYMRKTSPELAHFTSEEHAVLLAIMGGRAAHLHRCKGPNSPLYRRPRSRTVFPRQHSTCAICGALMYPVEGERLMCSSALGREGCWNRVRPSEAFMRENILAAVIETARSEPRFTQFLVNQA
jgi:Recombinase